MERIDRSYMGKGNIYLKLRGGNTGFFHFGNCSREDKKPQKDFTRAGGGNSNSVSCHPVSHSTGYHGQHSGSGSAWCGH